MINSVKTLLTLLLIQYVATEEGYNCHDKTFRCVNSTHFLICVALGNGVSTSVDFYEIKCPPQTFCRNENQFECELDMKNNTAVAATVTEDFLNVIQNEQNITAIPNFESTTYRILNEGSERINSTTHIVIEGGKAALKHYSYLLNTTISKTFDDIFTTTNSLGVASRLQLKTEIQEKYSDPSDGLTHNGTKGGIEKLHNYSNKFKTIESKMIDDIFPTIVSLGVAPEKLPISETNQQPTQPLVETIKISGDNIYTLSPVRTITEKTVTDTQIERTMQILHNNDTRKNLTMAIRREMISSITSIAPENTYKRKILNYDLNSAKLPSKSLTVTAIPTPLNLNGLKSVLRPHARPNNESKSTVHVTTTSGQFDYDSSIITNTELILTTDKPMKGKSKSHMTTPLDILTPTIIIGRNTMSTIPSLNTTKINLTIGDVDHQTDYFMEKSNFSVSFIFFNSTTKYINENYAISTNHSSNMTTLGFANSSDLDGNNITTKFMENEMLSQATATVERLDMLNVKTTVNDTEIKFNTNIYLDDSNDNVTQLSTNIITIKQKKLYHGPVNQESLMFTTLSSRNDEESIDEISYSFNSKDESSTRPEYISSTFNPTSVTRASLNVDQASDVISLPTLQTTTSASANEDLTLTTSTAKSEPMEIQIPAELYNMNSMKFYFKTSSDKDTPSSQSTNIKAIVEKRDDKTIQHKYFTDSSDVMNESHNIALEEKTVEVSSTTAGITESILYNGLSLKDLPYYKPNDLHTLKTTDDIKVENKISRNKTNVNNTYLIINSSVEESPKAHPTTTKTSLMSPNISSSAPLVNETLTKNTGTATDFYLESTVSQLDTDSLNLLHKNYTSTPEPHNLTHNTKKKLLNEASNRIRQKQNTNKTTIIENTVPSFAMSDLVSQHNFTIENNVLYRTTSLPNATSSSTSTTVLNRAYKSLKSFKDNVNYGTLESIKQGNEPTKVRVASSINNFTCHGKPTGKYPDFYDRKKFFVCAGMALPIMAYCPFDSIYVASRNRCCLSLDYNNCLTEGRFRDAYSNNSYFIYQRNKSGLLIRYKIKCQAGYYVSTSIQCSRNKANSKFHLASNTPASPLRRIRVNPVKTLSDDAILLRNKMKSNRTCSQFHCSIPGRFKDACSEHTYYSCETNVIYGLIRFKLTCLKGYVLNSISLKCEPNFRMLLSTSKRLQLKNVVKSQSKKDFESTSLNNNSIALKRISEEFNRQARGNTTNENQVYETRY